MENLQGQPLPFSYIFVKLDRACCYLDGLGRVRSKKAHVPLHDISSECFLLHHKADRVVSIIDSASRGPIDAKHSKRFLDLPSTFPVAMASGCWGRGHGSESQILVLKQVKYENPTLYCANQ